jgi:CheY-like chemotaxis protein
MESNREAPLFISGTAAGRPEQLLRNTNITIWFCVVFGFISSVVNYFLNYTYSFFICSGLAVSLILCITFLHNRYRISRIIWVIVTHLCILSMNLVEGLGAGNYLYFFIFFIVAVFIFGYEEKGLLVFTYSCTLLSLVCIFFMAPPHSVLQRVPLENERATFSYNLISAVLFTTSLSLLLLRNNFRSASRLENSQRFLNTVYNTSLDAVFIVDTRTGKIVSGNDNTIPLFDVKDIPHMKTKRAAALFAGIPANMDLEKLMEPGPANWQGEVECVTCGGIVFPGYVSIVSFCDRNVWYKKISILDITDMKRAQGQVLEAKEKAELAVKAKSQFLSNMSHELRTPLNGIIGTANLLLQEEYPKEHTAHFELLRYSSEHMLGLVNDVLDFSKIEAGKMNLEKEPLLLPQMLHSLKHLFKNQFEQKGIALLWETDDRLTREFLADKMRISEVLSNIIANALKFTQTGSVTIKSALLKSNSRLATVSFSVTDTGVGIPENKQDLIFESFTQAETTTTRRYGGTGLGLAISKRIVEMYNGKLQVTSAPGTGSCFSFTLDLPFNLRPAAYIQETAFAETPDLQGLRILIAEDNKINMMVACRFLAKWNATITEAENGRRAMERYQKEPFDLLLLDLEMPEMDGHELVKQIRLKDKTIPAIAFTAAVYDNMQQELAEQGFTDYLQKPFRPEDLYRKIKQYAVVNQGT